MDEADVAVAAVSCTLRLCGGMGGRLAICAGALKYACFAQRELENTMKSECLRMRRSRCRAKGGVGGGYTPPIQRGFTRHAGKCAAADPEGFAHSAAAEGKSSAGQEQQRAI